MSDSALPSDPTRIESFQLGEQSKPKKKRRVFMWFFLAVQVVFALWIIAGLSGSPVDEYCAKETFSEFYTLEDCKAAFGVGAGIGLMMILLIWVFVDFILALGWAIVKLARR